MEIEKYIIQRANKILDTNDTTIVNRLEGGMSNYTFVIESNKKKYTYRVPGKFAEKFVDRDIEKANIEMVDTLGLNNKTTYFDIVTGEKMAEYIEGTILSDTDVCSYDSLSAKALKTLHNSNLKFQDYDAFGRLDLYEQYCRDLGHIHPDDYKQLRQNIDKLHQAYVNIAQVPCHCDYQPSNLVLSNNKFYVFDWEYAGMNDPFYDIACYGNAGIDDGQQIALRYQGSDGMNGGQAGDLIIVISVRPHSVFERDGDDLYCDVPITFAEAALGAEIDIQTLEGSQKYTIPEGTQTGTVFTLRNMGVQRVNNPKIRGNLYITVNVEVPKNLTAEQKNLLEKFASSCGESNYSKRTGFFKKHRKNGN